jgi:replicative superfamily II helicase
LNKSANSRENIKLLATWLGGHSYETKYRPIPLEEHLVCEGKVYSAKTAISLMKKPTGSLKTAKSHVQIASEPIKTVAASPHPEFSDPVLNAVVSLANETVKAGYGVLVFSSSRPGCEKDARWISRVMPTIEEVGQVIKAKRMELLSDLRALSTGIDSVLEQTVPFGVVFHRGFIVLAQLLD